MIRAFALAVGQLGDPKIRRIIMISLLATIIVYAVLCGGAAWLMFGTTLLNGLPLWESILDWGAIVLVPVVAWLLFPAVITGILGVFLEDVVKAVEARHYPDLPPGRDIPLAESLIGSVRLVLASVALNLLMLPLLLFPLVGQAAFVALNGYLISREYFELVGLRRQPTASVRTIRRAHLGSIWTMGILTALILLIPVVNILAPVLGVAAMTHRAHRLPQRPLLSA
ncbi:EI24 domain-containing protein [Insolitispirillum peregrinum]|uniref:Uncharacterized protein involved in cysteine biosynthesis n=1 Tax=Insolitispirillum peregrinum TaxID=80876 RepID=A0A1N7JSK8_9PROT|nr:EI24 domain-containing protein [Insolitispirillum peregrinum]SIS52359.1 Uncharacterized protein involved in cysteine biosynthesis [Insolitispirillum peregrinum]